MGKISGKATNYFLLCLPSQWGQLFKGKIFFKERLHLRKISSSGKTKQEVTSKYGTKTWCAQTSFKIKITCQNIGSIMTDEAQPDNRILWMSLMGLLLHKELQDCHLSSTSKFPDILQFSIPSDSSKNIFVLYFNSANCITSNLG